MVPVPEMAAFGERFGFQFVAHAIGNANRSGRVERPFSFIERNFLAGRTFSSWEDLNQRAREWGDKVNSTYKKHIRAVPRELFAVDRLHLKPLPAWIPEVYRLQQRLVDIEGYVALNSNRYSVPVDWIGRRVEVRETKDKIEIQLDPRRLVTHRRIAEAEHQRVMLAEHRPPRGHRDARPDPHPEEKAIITAAHKRDMVALGARRRHGKTSFVTDLAVQLALGAPDFLGYEIPNPRRSLSLILEDDPGEYQEKLRRVIGTGDTGGRVRVVTREDFLHANVPLDGTNADFSRAVKALAAAHKPDLIVLDNLGAPRWRGLQRLAAIIVPAHPRKEDPQNPIDLVKNPMTFFESIMGSSHFINSMGSLWGLQRCDGEPTAFLGGRQRGDGQQGASYLEMDDEGHFYVVSNYGVNLALVCNTRQRTQAWGLLPDPPATFGYREAATLVKPALRSGSSFAAWMRECRRLRLVLGAPDGKLVKARGPAPVRGAFRGRG